MPSTKPRSTPPSSNAVRARPSAAPASSAAPTPCSSPRARIDEARGIIGELGGGHALVAYRTAAEERERSRRAFLTVAGAILLVAALGVVLRFVYG